MIRSQKDSGERSLERVPFSFWVYLRGSFSSPGFSFLLFQRQRKKEGRRRKERTPNKKNPERPLGQLIFSFTLISYRM